MRTNVEAVGETFAGVWRALVRHLHRSDGTEKEIPTLTSWRSFERQGPIAPSAREPAAGHKLNGLDKKEGMRKIQ